MKIITFLVASSLATSSLGMAFEASCPPPKTVVLATNLSDEIAHTLKVVAKYAHENTDVISTAQLFLTHLSDSYAAGEGMIDKDLSKIFEATEYAAYKHRHQQRKNPDETPYIIHPIAVADHLLTIGKVRDPDILIAALLHDTVEDTDATFKEIRALFGRRVKNLVREVTDDRALSKMERKRLQIVHAPDKSAGAAQIKLGDKFCNLSDLMKSPPIGWERIRIDAYFNWAERVVQALPWVNGSLLEAVEAVIAEYRSSPHTYQPLEPLTAIF